MPADSFFYLEYPDISALSPLCREYQVDWLTEKIKESILDEGWNQGETDVTLKYLTLSEGMGFGSSFDEVLINAFSDSFISIHMCPDFMSLSRKMQVMIARKRLWFLLRSFDDDDRSLILNEEDCGFLSIFEEQSVCNFKCNNIEQE